MDWTATFLAAAGAGPGEQRDLKDDYPEIFTSLCDRFQARNQKWSRSRKTAAKAAGDAARRTIFRALP